jgi:VIT1/CCC1 family predicted Fe2+/Mn2+ transporter
MPDRPVKSSKRVLDPIDRTSEVLFGLIMVLTYTGSLSIAQTGRDDVRVMLVGAVGCNLAWGIIDAILYLMGSAAEKHGRLTTFLAVRAATDPRQAQRLIADSLPPVVASILQPEELESMRLRLVQMREPAPRARLGPDDWLGAAAVFLLVFVSTFPVVLPFIVMTHVAPAMRVSNTIAIALLFLAGYTYGRQTNYRPAWLGCWMVVLGAALAGLTMALGG